MEPEHLEPTERALERTREALREVKQLLAGEARAVYQESQILSKAEHDLEETRGELRQLEMQFIQNEKMASIGRLSAGIAHDINNPVGYILSNLTTLREYLETLVRLLEALRQAAPERAEALWRECDADYVIEDFRKAIAESLEGADRIRRIVTNLREFSHVGDAEMKPANLNEGLEKTILLCSNELKYKTTVHRDFGTLPPVVCHEQRIHQVFTNLLLNAAQAIEKRGEIHVSTRPEGEWAVIRIRDTGVGIPKEHLPRLFAPFFTTKPVGKGTGLGLHVAQKIVAAHGGTIEAASEPGKGTEFTVRLPIQGPPR